MSATQRPRLQHVPDAAAVAQRDAQEHVGLAAGDPLHAQRLCRRGRPGHGIRSRRACGSLSCAPRGRRSPRARQQHPGRPLAPLDTSRQLLPARARYVRGELPRPRAGRARADARAPVQRRPRRGNRPARAEQHSNPSLRDSSSPATTISTPATRASTAAASRSPGSPEPPTSTCWRTAASDKTQDAGRFLVHPRQVVAMMQRDQLRPGPRAQRRRRGSEVAAGIGAQALLRRRLEVHRRQRLVRRAERGVEVEPLGTDAAQRLAACACRSASRKALTAELQLRGRAGWVCSAASAP